MLRTRFRQVITYCLLFSRRLVLTRGYIKGHICIPRDYAWQYGALFRALSSFKLVYSLSFAPRCVVWKDVKCPSWLLSYTAKDTSLLINIFSSPPSSLFFSLKTATNDVYGGFRLILYFKLSTFTKVCLISFRFMILWFRFNVWFYFARGDFFLVVPFLWFLLCVGFWGR